MKNRQLAEKQIMETTIWVAELHVPV